MVIINGDGVVSGLKTELTTGRGFRPIGGMMYMTDPDDFENAELRLFSGNIIGDYKLIKNLHIDVNSENQIVFSDDNGDMLIMGIGLFGGVIDSTIDKLIVSGQVNCSMSEGIAGAGGLVGFSSTMQTISNTWARPTTELVPISTDISITNCHIKIDGNLFAGIIGTATANNITIERCSNAGNITKLSDGESSPNFSIANSLAAINELNITDCKNVGATVSMVYQAIGGTTNITDCINDSGETESVVIGTVVAQSGNLIADRCVNNSQKGSVFERVLCNNASTTATVRNCKNNTQISSYAAGITTFEGTNALIENCENKANITHYSYAHGICGTEATNLTVRDCINTGSITTYEQSPDASCSGITGANFGSATNLVVTNCKNTGIIIGSKSAAGVVASTIYATNAITNCINTGNVSGRSAAGILYMDTYGGGTNTATVNNSYNSGSITATYDAGGLVAGLRNTQSVSINNSYNSGSVNGATSGAITEGYVVNTLNNCYYLTSSCATAVSASTTGTYSAKTDTEMKRADFVTLLNSNLQTGWLRWKVVQNAYPTYE